MCFVNDLGSDHQVNASFILYDRSIPGKGNAALRGDLAEAYPRGTLKGLGPSPWDLPSGRFSGLFPFNYIIRIFAECVRKIFLACGRTEQACSVVVGLR